MAKRSFFERLTGSVRVDDDSFEEELPQPVLGKKDWEEEEDQGDGQLSVDVFQTPSEIVIKTIVAGVRPEDLDIMINRDMVAIRGKREESREINDDSYFHKELYWGSFSRTILLPEEVEVDEAEAESKHGLLTIRLPKINKEKQTKIRVKTIS